MDIPYIVIDFFLFLSFGYYSLIFKTTTNTIGDGDKYRKPEMDNLESTNWTRIHFWEVVYIVEMRVSFKMFTKFKDFFSIKCTY